MAEIVLQADSREPGSTNVARRLRNEGMLPAVVYGGGKDSIPVTLDPRDVIEILKSESGQNTVFQLKVGSGGASETVMIFDYQVDPITHHLQHADLVRIAMDKLIEVDVAIELVGEPEGVKTDGGVLDISLRELTVECLPADIPDQVELDVSELEIGDSISVSAIRMPPNVTLITDPDKSVASVVPPVSEEELEAAVAAVEPFAEGEEPELVGAEEEEEGVPEEEEEAAEEEPEKKEEADETE